MRLLRLALRVAPLLVAGAAAAATPRDMGVLEASVRFSGDRGSLRAEGDLLGGSWLEGLDPIRDGFRVEFGPLVLLDLSSPAQGTRVRAAGSRGWEVRAKGLADGRGRLRLFLSTESGQFRFRASGFEADGLLAAGPSGVTISLSFAEETRSVTLDFAEDGTRRWEYRRPVTSAPPPGGGGGGGTLPPGTNLALVSLGGGTSSGFQSQAFLVLRDAASWQAAWAQHGGGGAAPAVDFSSEMVVAAFLGSRPMTGFLCTVTGVQVQGGGGVRVTVVETGPGTGCMPGPATQPFHVVRTARVDGGPDTLDLQVATWCP